MRVRHLPALLLAAVAPLVSCSKEDPPQAAVRTAVAGAAYTNVLREDYVGPETCGKCHQENHSRWKLHPHRRMNQEADDRTVVGDFSGARRSYGTGEAVFRREDGKFFVDYLRDGKPVRTFRVTRTIGHRYLQEYVGFQVRGPEPPDDVLYKEETRLKFGYMLAEKRWVPQSYLDVPYGESEVKEDGSVRYDPFEPERSPFNNRCIHCHNTYPYELRLYTDPRLQGFPSAPVPAVEALLRSRPGYQDQRGNPRLPTDALVTVGISCESCHFGGREHSKDPKKPIRFLPTHPALAGWIPEPANARQTPAVVNSICRQCHFSEAGSWSDGSALVNSMESIEQDRGACASQIRCIDCHNPHLVGPNAGTSERKDATAACVRCHGSHQSSSSAREHGHHDPAAVSCLDCHMPRIVHGFEGANRSHRISSPTEPAILGSGMANACNLCHLDRSLAWTQRTLEAWWGKRVDLPPALEAVYGKGHDKPAGDAWLAQPFGMLKVVAGDAIARSAAGKKALPRLLETLEEPNAYLRTRLLADVERLLGRRLDEKEYALTGSPERRREQLRQLLKRFSE